MIELALIAALATAAGPAPGEVHGTVVSDQTGEPIPGVRVSVAGSSAETTTDETGLYTVRGLPDGHHELRFSRFGYHDLTVEVAVPSRGELRLDVRLRPRPIAMAPISVFAGGDGRADAGPADVGPLPPGSRVLSISTVRPPPLTNEPDALRALEAIPGVDMGEETPTAFHVRGGSADQNRVLLDGIPVYNAYHTSGVLGGVNPDAVSAISFHAGAVPARYGGGLSSVVDIASPHPAAGGFSLRGGIGPADLRSTVETRLPGGGGFLLGGRRTTYDVVPRGAFDRNASSEFEEMLAKASIPALGGVLDLLALHGSNGLSSFAIPEDDVPAAEASGALDPRHRYNPVEWTTNTDAAIWRWSDGDGTEARASGWRAGTHSMAAWGTGESRVRFDHGLEHLGLAAEASRTRPWGTVRLGFGLERLRTSYTTRPETGDGTRDTNHRASLASVTNSATAFVEHRWIPHDRWLVDNGLRVVLGAGGGMDLEPRVAVHYRPGPAIALSAGYARIHQYAQSLRNEESLLNVAYAFDPLVSAADPRVPVARSDQLTASAEIRLSERLRLEIDGYARWLDGLVLVAPVTAEPFAVDGFAIGEGAARGVGASLLYDGPKTDLEVVAEWSSATRRTDSLEYRPTFERRGSFAAAATREIGWRTTVRGAFRAAAGRPTSGLESGFEWEPLDRLTGEIEFGGTPLRRTGALNGERLPAYLRLDVGVRRTWRPSFLGPTGSLVTWMDVLNVFDRENALALEPRPDAQRWGRIPLSGTSIAFGVDWSF